MNSDTSQLKGVGTRWFGTLKARLMLLSAGVIAACVLATTTVLIQRIEQRTQHAVMALEAEHMESLAAMAGQRVVGMQRMLRVMAERLPMQAVVDPVRAREYIDAKIALGASFDGLFIANADGQTMAQWDGKSSETPNLNIAGRDFHQRTMAQGLPVVSPLVQGHMSKVQSVFFTMPVFDAQRMPVAVVGGSIRLNERNLLNDLTFAARQDDGQALTIVVDANGVIISHPTPGRVGSAIDSEPRLTAAVLRWTAQGRPIEPSADVHLEDGNFVAVVGVPGADWAVFRAVPESALLGGMAQARKEAYYWAGGFALAGSLLILLVLAWLLGPLARLRRRANRLQDEGLALDEGWPEAAGEIGDLSRALRRSLQEGAALSKTQLKTMQQMRSILGSAPLGIAFTRQRVFELVSAKCSALLGWTESELTGRLARDIYAAEADYDTMGPKVGLAFSMGKSYVGEHQLRRRDGTVFWACLQGSPVDARDPTAGTIWILEDVTIRRAERETLAWSASHDMLTRLMNRAAFEQRLHDWLADDSVREPAALLLIDLDHFKRVNDTAGHAAGDEVLRKVAATLLDHVRGADAAARLGGDEFALFLPHCDAQAGLMLAQRICDAVSRLGVSFGAEWLGVGASIGVVCMEPGTPLRAADWKARADAACYEAKHQGRGRACLAGPAPVLQLVG